jgi:RNA polymerase sigma-70 factor (ECF subfamily)
LTTPESHTFDEVTVIERAKAGDEKAFRDLVHRYEDTVYRFAFNVCRSEEMATETLQNTFINVYNKLDSFDGRSTFSTWLYSIVTNNCLMKRRSIRSHDKELSLEDEKILHDAETSLLSARETSPMGSLLNEELKHIFDEAIKKLPVDYRIVFVMRDIEDMSAAEVSKILGISVAAVKSRLFRAREFLRKVLEPYVEGKL